MGLEHCDSEKTKVIDYEERRAVLMEDGQFDVDLDSLSLSDGKIGGKEKDRQVSSDGMARLGV